MYYLLFAFFRLLARLPLSLLYGVADVLFLILYYLVGYRKKVVRQNLKNSFPEKSMKELRSIERRFFRYLCDIIIETIKQLHMDADEVRKRVTYENMDLIIRHRDEGRSVMLMTAHYCNWEWSSAICLHLPDDYKAYPVYQELTNAHFDRFMYKLRSRFGSVNIEKRELIREMLNMRNNGVHGLFGMISDQSPSGKAIRYRMPFLNQDTPVFLGTEQLARKYDYPVYYMDVSRKRRGYYHVVILPIAEKPLETEEYEITHRFMQIVEERIKSKPEFWLWSHKRWKHSRTTNS